MLDEVGLLMLKIYCYYYCGFYI